MSHNKTKLLNDFQRDFPLVPRPYQQVAEKLGMTEEEVLRSINLMISDGEISRVGATIRPNTVGVSTLAAMAIPECEIEHVAQIVSTYSEVNHNYQREHRYNLWFVVVSDTEENLQQVLEDMSEKTGFDILDLPLVRPFHIDLGFELK